MELTDDMLTMMEKMHEEQVRAAWSIYASSFLLRFCTHGTHSHPAPPASYLPTCPQKDAVRHSQPRTKYIGQDGHDEDEEEEEDDDATADPSEAEEEEEEEEEEDIVESQEEEEEEDDDEVRCHRLFSPR